MWKNYFKKVGRRTLFVVTVLFVVWLFLAGYIIAGLGFIGIWLALAFGKSAAKADDELDGI